MKPKSEAGQKGERDNFSSPLVSLGANPVVPNCRQEHGPGVQRHHPELLPVKTRRRDGHPHICPPEHTPAMLRRDAPDMYKDLFMRRLDTQVIHPDLITGRPYTPGIHQDLLTRPPDIPGILQILVKRRQCLPDMYEGPNNGAMPIFETSRGPSVFQGKDGVEEDRVPRRSLPDNEARVKEVGAEEAGGERESCNSSVHNDKIYSLFVLTFGCQPSSPPPPHPSPPLRSLGSLSPHTLM